jgi:hypothetical protein
MSVDNARPGTDEPGVVEAPLLENLGPPGLEGVGSVDSTI